MKKLLGVISLVALSVLITNGSTNAKEFERTSALEVLETNEVASEEIINDEISILGLSAPPKSAVVDLSKKDLNFAGKANGSTLYTNSNFTGQKKATYSIKNNSTSTLTVKLHKRGSIFAMRTWTISAGATGGGGVYPNGDLNPSDLYYLSFSAPSDFSGRLY